MSPTEEKRKQMVEKFLPSWFLLGGFLSSDTYKRTMWSIDDNLSNLEASYHLTLRKGFPETNAGERQIMADHEWLLRQYFLWKPTGSALDM